MRIVKYREKPGNAAGVEGVQDNIRPDNIRQLVDGEPISWL